MFRRVCAQFCTGVAIAAVVDAAGRPHGLTINSFTSVSLQPAMVLICIDNRAAVLSVFREAAHFSINFLGVGQQQISNRFATAPDDRFVGVEWSAGPHGSPVIAGSIAVLECGNVQAIAAGDHTILLAEALYAHVEGGEPLVYFSSGYVKLAD